MTKINFKSVAFVIAFLHFVTLAMSHVIRATREVLFNVLCGVECLFWANLSQSLGTTIGQAHFTNNNKFNATTAAETKLCHNGKQNVRV